MSSEAVELSADECEALLLSLDVGRIGVIEDGFPLVFPISYRVALHEGRPVIAIRTRPGNVIDRPGRAVSFEIDGVDAGHDGGWSVLVRGTLIEASPDPESDSHPMVADGRDAWRIVVPSSISGRRVTARPLRWSFHPAGYV